jgi:mRNA-capping enzyme
MMYIMEQQKIFFIDRNNAVFQIDGLTFLWAHDCSRHLEDTLLDGEMVIDKVGGRTHPRYLIYDLVSLRGNNIREKDFNVRYETIQREIIDPRTAAMKEGRVHRQREPFGVHKKEFWPIGSTKDLLSDRFKAKLLHEMDGLIFQPVDEQYRAGPCPTVLKWKPPSHNSIDFRLKVFIEDRPGMVNKRVWGLYVGGMDMPFRTMKWTKSLTQYNGKIIECRFDSDLQEWVFMRERTDKSFPNSYTTADSVWKSIHEPVNEQDLMNLISRNVI